MKATGIVRRIDELGRIVIPKEIRRTFRIKEGTPLEIFSGDNGELILKKYSPILELTDFACEIAESINNTLNCIVLICDLDKIIAVSGGSKKTFEGKNLVFAIEKILHERDCVIKNENQIIKVCECETFEFKSQLIFPLSSNGDVIGGIILLNKVDLFNQGDIKIVKTMANFIEKQIS